jgi:hypothetical protein
MPLAVVILALKPEDGTAENERMCLMAALLVQVERFVDSHQPGFVECALVDVDGQRHVFVEKGPIVSTANLWIESEYPQPGYLDCTIDREWTDEWGRHLVRACTKEPWSIESVAGEATFTVFDDQVVRT